MMPTQTGSIAEGRQRIDEIDAQLLALLEARRDVSARIQRVRIEQGGSRVEHARELVILRRYSERLGAGGAGLARALLAYCRKT